MKDPIRREIEAMARRNRVTMDVSEAAETAREVGRLVDENESLKALARQLAQALSAPCIAERAFDPNDEFPCYCDACESKRAALATARERGLV